MRDLRVRDVLRVHRRDLHRNVVDSFLDCVVHSIRLRLDDDADAAAAVRVAADEALSGLDLRESADGELLADDSRHLDELVVHSLRIVFFPGLSQESVDVCSRGMQRLCRDLLDVGAELLVLRNEVGLGVDFDDSRLLIVVRSDAAEAFRRDPVSLLLGLHDAVLAEPFDRLVHVAVRLGEGLLAVHHAGAGHLS